MVLESWGREASPTPTSLWVLLTYYTGSSHRHTYMDLALAQGRCSKLIQGPWAGG